MNASNVFFKIIIICFISLSALSTKAQDRIFTYTYQSGVLNKGQHELEIWNTIRTGKKDYFLGLDNRNEFEIGLAKNLQTSFYLNITSLTHQNHSNLNNYLNTENKISFSNEWKYKLKDPVADPVGLALYAEYAIGGEEHELEGKLIIDKKIGDLTFAFNGVYENEHEANISENKLEWEREDKGELYLSCAYSVNSVFHLTLENAFKNVVLKNRIAHSALYSGIGFSSVFENYWVNFTIMPQVAAFKGITNGNSDLDEFEKIQFRLLFSYAF